MIVSDYKYDEIDVFELVQHLVKNKSKIIAFLLVSVLIMGGLYLTYLSKAGHYRYVLDEIKVSLEFPGAEEQKYPDGLRFDATDFISNNILRILYEKYNFKDLGDFDSFVKAFSASYAVKQSGIEVNAKDKETIRETIVDYSRVVIQMTSRGQNGIGKSFLAKIQQSDRESMLSDIPRLWSDDFKKHHLRYTTFNPVKSIDLTTLNKKSYAEIRNLLRSGADLVAQNIRKLSSFFPLPSFRSKKYDLSIDEYLFELESGLLPDIELWYSYIQGRELFKNPQKAMFRLMMKLTKTEREQNRLRRVYSATVSVLSENYSNLPASSLTGAKKLASTYVGQGNSLLAKGTMDPEAYNSIYKLALKSQNFKYKNKLTDKLIDLSSKISEAEYDIKNIKHDIKLIEGLIGGGKPIVLPSPNIDKQLSLLIENFKRLTKVGTEIADEYFASLVLRYGNVAKISAPFDTKVTILPEGKKLFQQMLLFPLIANAVLFMVFLGYIVFRENYKKHQQSLLKTVPELPDKHSSDKF